MDGPGALTRRRRTNSVRADGRDDAEVPPDAEAPGSADTTVDENDST